MMTLSMYLYRVGPAHNLDACCTTQCHALLISMEWMARACTCVGIKCTSSFLWSKLLSLLRQGWVIHSFNTYTSLHWSD